MEDVSQPRLDPPDDTDEAEDAVDDEDRHYDEARDRGSVHYAFSAARAAEQLRKDMR